MAQQPLPFKSLDAATAAGAGASKDLEGVFSKHTIVMASTGNPTTVSVTLEGSHDGVNWFDAGAPTITLSVTKATVDTHLLRYVRANLITLSGGSSPTVTVTIASA